MIKEKDSFQYSKILITTFYIDSLHQGPPGKVIAVSISLDLYIRVSPTQAANFVLADKGVDSRLKTAIFKKLMLWNVVLFTDALINLPLTLIPSWIIAMIINIYFHIEAYWNRIQ